MPLEDCIVGHDVQLVEPANVYGCTIGDHVRIGPYVEIQRGAIIGSYVKIGSHSFLCGGINVGDRVFIGHGVMTCNDVWPRGYAHQNESGSGEMYRLKGPGDWDNLSPVIEDGASIGSGAVLLPGVIIGEGAMIGAGAVVTMNIGADMVAVGNPARIVGTAPYLRQRRAGVHVLHRRIKDE